MTTTGTKAERIGFYKPAIIKTPTGKFIAVGTIPSEMEPMIFETREAAEYALQEATA